MDRLKGKRISGPVMPEITRRLVLHENMKKKDDKSVHMCSRIGCSSRIDSTERAFIDYKAKSTVSSSFRSPSNGKESLGSSSRSMSGFCGSKKASMVTSSESSSAHDESPTTESRGKTKETSMNVHSEDSVSAEVMNEAENSSRSMHKRPDLVTREARMVNSSQNSRPGVNRHGLKDLRSKSGSDIPAFNPNSTRKCNIFRMRNSDGESSSSNKGIKTDRSVIEVRNQRYPQGNGMSESTRNRNSQMVRDNNVLSSSARRSSGSYGRTGHSGEVAALRVPLPTTLADLNPRSAEFLNSTSNSYSSSISNNVRLRSSMEPVSLSEAGFSRSLMNRDSFRHHNMSGVAEVLLALERLEQDQELTYETNLYLNGASIFHDQHRDMRLDIDNMSYEELLALGEKIGTVSTALSEESLLKSLKSSIYRPREKLGGLSLNKEDDVKCSICQEEYIDEDEVGTLPCRHRYHVSCVQQWLRLKNWCPICKTSAESKSQSFSLM